MSISLLSLGRNQVAVGLVPIDFANKSSESALSVYPVAIVNCKEEVSFVVNSLVLKCLI